MFNKKMFLSLIFMHYCVNIALTQSLITNGSFENFRKCPNHQGQVDRVENWSNPLSKYTSPDYFHTCSNGFSFRFASLPKNWIGYQNPQNGEGHIGLVIQHYSLYNDSIVINKYKEFAQTKLIRSLDNNELICIQFYISQAESSTFSIDRIPITFSNKKRLYEKTKKKYGIFSQHFLGNTIYCESDTFLTDKESWTEIKGIYKAKGGEQFLAINGNDALTYKKNIMPKRRRYKNTSIDSYYYIDNISLRSISDSSECKCNNKKVVDNTKIKDAIDGNIHEEADTSKNIVFIEKPILTIEKPLVLNNIQFEFNSANLINQKLIDLDKLASYLIKNEKIIIEIGGHTDNIGDKVYNLELSQKRAESIRQYLIKKGVTKNQILSKGYGESQPIDNNSSKSGRKNNRRVEIKIIQNK